MRSSTRFPTAAPARSGSRPGGPARGRCCGSPTTGSAWLVEERVRDRRSIGLEVIHASAAQLGAQLEIRSDGGVEVRLTFNEPAAGNGAARDGSAVAGAR